MSCFFTVPQRFICREWTPRCSYWRTRQNPTLLEMSHVNYRAPLNWGVNWKTSTFFWQIKRNIYFNFFPLKISSNCFFLSSREILRKKSKYEIALIYHATCWFKQEHRLNSSHPYPQPELYPFLYKSCYLRLRRVLRDSQIFNFWDGMRVS